LKEPSLSPDDCEDLDEIEEQDREDKDYIPDLEGADDSSEESPP
jgi:hypothetical protein